MSNPNWLPGMVSSADGTPVLKSEQVRISNTFQSGFYVVRNEKPVMVEVKQCLS